MAHPQQQTQPAAVASFHLGGTTIIPIHADRLSQQLNRFSELTGASPSQQLHLGGAVHPPQPQQQPLQLHFTIPHRSPQHSTTSAPSETQVHTLNFLQQHQPQQMLQLGANPPQHMQLVQLLPQQQQSAMSVPSTAHHHHQQQPFFFSPGFSPQPVAFSTPQINNTNLNFSQQQEFNTVTHMHQPQQPSTLPSPFVIPPSSLPFLHQQQHQQQLLNNFTSSENSSSDPMPTTNALRQQQQPQAAVMMTHEQQQNVTSSLTLQQQFQQAQIQHHLQPEPSSNLIVNYLPKDMTPQEFTEIFSQIGIVKASRIATDDYGASRGYGFVLYDRFEDAVRAMRELQGVLVKGRFLKLGFAGTPPRNFKPTKTFGMNCTPVDRGPNVAVGSQQQSNIMQTPSFLQPMSSFSHLDSGCTPAQSEQPLSQNLYGRSAPGVIGEQPY